MTLLFYLCLNFLRFEWHKPEFFSLSANPWYYLTGLFCFASSAYGLYLYVKLPPKEDIMHSGKKAILK